MHSLCQTRVSFKRVRQKAGVAAALTQGGLSRQKYKGGAQILNSLQMLSQFLFELKVW